MSIFYDDIGSPREASPKSEEVVNNKPQEEPSLQQHHLPKECKAPKDLSIDNIIRDIERGVTTIHFLNLFCELTNYYTLFELIL